MSYLDPKERVIDLRLTSYGRHLLAIGKLNPTYYAFFDDDIIYDGAYASIDEGRDNIEPRIQENTPRLAAQSVFSARETAVFDASPNIVNDLTIGQNTENLSDKDKQLLLAKTRIQEGPEQTEVLQQPLGRSNSAYSSDPAWNVSFLKAPMSGSTDYLVVSSSQGTFYRNIPQLNVDIQYSIIRNSPQYNKAIQGTALVSGGNFSELKGKAMQTEVGTPIFFENGASIAVFQDQSIILRIEESNSFFENENFEIECFEVETVDGKDNLIPLQFTKKITKSENGDASSIERFLNIISDEEIPLEEICPVLKQDKSRQFFHKKIFDCEEFEDVGAIDIYTEDDEIKDLCE